MFLPKAMLSPKQREWANFSGHAIFKRTRVRFAKVLVSEARGPADQAKGCRNRLHLSMGGTEPVAIYCNLPNDPSEHSQGKS